MEIFCIYLIDEGEKSTLIKAYIQLDSACRRWHASRWTILTSISCSSESSGFTLGLEQGEDVTLSDRSLHVSHEGSVDGSLELDLNLRNTTSWAYKKQTRHTLIQVFKEGGLHDWRIRREGVPFEVCDLTAAVAAIALCAYKVTYRFCRWLLRQQRTRFQQSPCWI